MSWAAVLLCRLSNETTFYKRLLSVLLSIKVLCSIYQSVHLQSAEAVKWSTRLGSIYRVASMFTVGWRKRNLHWTEHRANPFIESIVLYCSCMHEKQWCNNVTFSGYTASVLQSKIQRVHQQTTIQTQGETKKKNTLCHKLTFASHQPSTLSSNTYTFYPRYIL